MRRTFYITIVLAAFAVASVNGFSASPKKAHTRAVSAPFKASSKATSKHASKKAKLDEPRAAKRTKGRAKAEVRLRPAVLKRSRRNRSMRADLASDYFSTRQADESKNSDDAPALENASFQTQPKPSEGSSFLSNRRSPLRGSLESLVRQNEKTEADNLERIEDEADLADRIGRKMLVPLPASSALTVNGKLPENHRFCRPWTASFLADLARQHAAQFHHPFAVSSAVRTVEYQKHLERINGNAAAAEGDIASPHLTGATIDIAKQGMSRQELAWMRSHLLQLQQANKIDVEEEFKQSCFHITVYKSYSPSETTMAGNAKP